MKKSYTYLILLCILFHASFANAQPISFRLDSVRQKLTAAVADYYKRYPQEKIFLHTDQNVYVGGQTIWYKAYAQAFGKPSMLSGVVYVRLSDARGRLIKQDMLPLKNGTAHGNIDLPDTLPTSRYQMRAFTSWMLNFDDDGIYHQDLYIQNTRTPVSKIPETNNVKAYRINFYPEGGDLVESNLSGIAFKATDERGLPVKVYGTVLNDKKQMVAKLATVHDGLGSFDLKTDANETYTAKVHFPDSSVQTIALPKVKKTGAVLRIIANTTTELEVMIIYQGQQGSYKDIIVAAVQNNGICGTYPLQLSRGANVFSFKKSSFSTGVLRLTVFDERALPLAERLVYINNNDQLNLSAQKDTVSFNPKGKNVFTLNLKGGDNQPVKANLSVAVTDAGMGPEPDNNICSYFLISSELHGYIHQPAYYFSNNSDTLKQQLDLVMLTSGWRHFKWDTVFNDKPRPLKYAFEHTPVIAGKIKNYNQKDDLQLKMLITNSDSSKNLVIAEPDSTGVFILKDYDRAGTANISYEVVNKKNKRQSVKVAFFKRDVDSVQFMASLRDTTIIRKPVISPAYIENAKAEQQARLNSGGIILKTVNINERKLSPTEILIKNHVQHLETDHAYTLDLANAPSIPPGNIITFINGKFPGLVITPSTDGQGASNFTYHGPSSLMLGKTGPDQVPNEPYFYIDEASATIGEVINIPLDDVALIRFAPPPVWFAPGNGGPTGALLIYTKRFGDEKKRNHSTFDQYSSMAIV
ncbi:hypothetical protein [Mucilaginibacter gotjawali]|uniref:MG2 domain protein n=2 Tax=Mucilaginibacter gotjawali TaxID=1550579 RepID=A0A0X8X3V2_9SPHI|nr:hypothetical protein [Mucilaginibacter gotjawali]MBB3056484.1 hypothetical protein [Mucilaginibacter gotjawali]BAU55191.1 MG2 domain protein [Mucilaginibacter gotjawali]